MSFSSQLVPAERSAGLWKMGCCLVLPWKDVLLVTV